MIIFHLLLLCLAADPPAAPSVSLRPAAQVSAPTILLKDIADLSPDGALPAVLIGPSPLPGLSRTIALGYVKLRLRQNGFDPDQMTFSEVQTVTVTRTRTTEPPPASGDPPSEVLAARRIERGHIIAAEDLSLPSPSESPPLLGLRATRFIEAGEPVTLAALEPVPVVDRGDLVTLIIDVGSIRIKAVAEVRDPASIGDLTKVRVLQTNKLLDALVLDSETVSLPKP